MNYDLHLPYHKQGDEDEDKDHRVPCDFNLAIGPDPAENVLCE